MLHPDLRTARFIPRLSWTPQLVRLLRRLPVPPARVPASLSVTNRTIPGPDGAPDVRVRLDRTAHLRPAAPALLWLHGGGHLIGKPEQDDRTCLAVARRGIAVVSVDYRLSPEHPFPAALDDAHAALTWLATPDGELAVDTDRIAVGGASAGGGLAAALAQRAHDEGGIRLALQLLVHPMLDDRTVLRDDAAPGSSAVPAYAVPARRADLTGLPPAWIGVGTADLFHDECVAYARRLEEAGVPVTLHVVDGAFHGFDAVFRNAPVTRRFIDAQMAALEETLGP